MIDQKERNQLIEEANIPIPRKICLCGSSRHPDLHQKVMMEETLKGNIVIPLGLYGHADFPKGAKEATGDADESGEMKKKLNKLHFAKIHLADEVIVVTVDGYVGESTRKEIEFASRCVKLKNIRFRNFDRNFDVPPIIV